MKLIQKTFKNFLKVSILLYIDFSLLGYAIPEFIIIGAAKSGTTTLFNYLIQHPKILKANFPSANNFTSFNVPNFKPTDLEGKEIRFFTHFYHKGVEWYKNLFPNKIEGIISGEASPVYMFYSEKVSKRISKCCPNVKLIAILRNPVDAIFSLYKMRKTILHIENRSFDIAVKDYLHLYHYADQLKHFFKLFKRESIYIAIYEDFFKDPKNKLNELYAFLGLEPYELQKYSIFWSNPEKIEMTPETKLFLTNYFYKKNEELEQLLKLNLPW